MAVEAMRRRGCMLLAAGAAPARSSPMPTLDTPQEFLGRRADASGARGPTGCGLVTGTWIRSD